MLRMSVHALWCESVGLGHCLWVICCLVYVRAYVISGFGWRALLVMGDMSRCVCRGMRKDKPGQQCDADCYRCAGLRMSRHTRLVTRLMTTGCVMVLWSLGV